MSKNALILIDLQQDYFDGGRFPLEGIDAATANAAQALAAARAAGSPVIHVRHEFPVPDAPFFAQGSAGAHIHEAVAPAAGEPVVTKAFPNAFRETNLAALLAERDVSAVTLVGAMSHICIDASARAAADNGLQVTVLHDAVATREVAFGDRTVAAADVHAAFMAALAFGIAEVRATEDYLKP